MLKANKDVKTGCKEEKFAHESHDLLILGRTRRPNGNNRLVISKDDDLLVD